MSNRCERFVWVRASIMAATLLALGGCGNSTADNAHEATTTGLDCRNRASVDAGSGAVTTACSDTSPELSTQPREPSSVASVSAFEREFVEPGPMLSSAALYGDLVWTAGHLPDGVAPDAPIEDQVNQVLDNLELTLERANAGFDTLLKTNVYLLDWEDWEAFNHIYEIRIGLPYVAPPRTTVDVDKIGLGYRIEIEMVAHVRHG